MCIVIDINALAMVFNEANARHSDFAPVKYWIESSNGFLVFGGTKYKSELKKTVRYLRLVRQLRDGGRAVSIKDSAVDQIEAEVSKKIDGTDCDDPHVIALLAASRCNLLCSCDSRSFPFIKDRSLYPKGSPRVSIYTSTKNRALLKKSDPASLMNKES